MKQRLVLFIFCVFSLIGILYWLIPQVTALYEETNTGWTTTVKPPTPTTTTPAVVTPTMQALPALSQTTTGSSLSTESVIWLAVLSVGFLILVQVAYSLSRRADHSNTNYGSAHFARGGELRELRVQHLAVHWCL